MSAPVATMSAIAPSKPAQTPTRNVPREFRAQAQRIAGDLLTSWVGDDRAKEATGRIAAALSASAASARNPQDFYDCTPVSVATCIAVAALTGIMPGTGPAALAYVVPQRARKGEVPQLQYSLSHRGLNALARRCGQTMIAVPIGHDDQVIVDADGEAMVVSMDIDSPPLTWDDLRGVVVVVKQLATGVVVHRGWVPKKLIETRRNMSRSFSGSSPQYSPWTTWPIEMAIKTGLHYAVARGWCVIDDTESARALSADTEDFQRDDRDSPANAPPPVGRQSLKLNGAPVSAPATATAPPAPEPGAGSQGAGEHINPTLDTAQPPEPMDQDRAGLADMIEDLMSRIAATDTQAALQVVGADMTKHRAWMGEEAFTPILAVYQSRWRQLQPTKAVK